MSYIDIINELSKGIRPEILDLSLQRKRGRAPSQAFSDFLTHREQGEWAEQLMFEVLKKEGVPYVPIRYGKADTIIAGDPRFKDFYETYQDELDTIGKRPDILLYKPDDYDHAWGDDISSLSQESLEGAVTRAAAGLEVRSSAYLSKKYEPKKERPSLSFTPKVEDLMVVLRWINIFGVPHFYFQVFFDAIYAISFKEILSLLCTADIRISGAINKKVRGYKDGELVFAIEKNPKNQFKETIHIFVDSGSLIANYVVEPELIGTKRELAGGRLLHYVSFVGGDASLDVDALLALIQEPY